MGFLHKWDEKCDFVENFLHTKFALGRPVLSGFGGKEHSRTFLVEMFGEKREIACGVEIPASRAESRTRRTEDQKQIRNTAGASSIITAGRLWTQ